MAIAFPQFHPSVAPANPRNYKAFLIGINYSSEEEEEEEETSDDTGSQDDRPSPLVGPVNDVKEMKKMLMELYGYRAYNIFTMTDEKEDKGTDRWPSRYNILEAMDVFVRNSSSQDSLVFYYAGHCGRNENDGTHGYSYMLTCDNRKIFGIDVREHLVSPLPKDCRLTAILDACYSDMLINLEHSSYTCHCFIRRRCQSNGANSGRVVDPRPRGSAFCSCEPLNGPLMVSDFSVVSLLVSAQISVSASSNNERTFEDGKRNGKGMTMKLIKILRKKPSIGVGELDQKLNHSLSKMAFKSVRNTRGTFRALGGRLSVGKRKKLEKKYTERGIFDFKPQTAQFECLYHPPSFLETAQADAERDAELVGVQETTLIISVG